MTNNVLVVGSDGYIGSLLCKKLQDSFSVTGYDTGYYRGAHLYSPQWNLPKIITKDIRLITLDDIRGFKAVICLSDLNDPLSQVYPDITNKINHKSLVRFASLCKKAEVEKFIYSSSASVYGFNPNKPMSETSQLSPITPYAKCKMLVEKYLLSLNDNRFSVTCLRNSTVYGISPSMRFDLVINYLCGTAVAKNVIELKSDGGAWRPFVHIEDVCNVFINILKLSRSSTSKLVINVGNGKKGNYRVIDIANIIQEMTKCDIVINDKNVDNRSYQINSKRLDDLGMSCNKDMKTEIHKMLNFFKKIELSKRDLNLNNYDRLKQINYLLKTKQLNKDFFWTKL